MIERPAIDKTLPKEPRWNWALFAVALIVVGGIFVWTLAGSSLMEFSPGLHPLVVATPLTVALYYYLYFLIRRDIFLRSLMRSLYPPAEIDVFISHAAVDEKLAEALAVLLSNAFATVNVRCTSVDGFRLEGGTEVDNRLRQEVYGSKVFVGLLTPGSVTSTWVLFELGARWGTRRLMIPLIANGLTPRDLGGPLQNRSALTCSSRAQLYQLIDEIASALGRQTSKNQNIERFLDDVVQLASTAGKSKIA